ncbi:uncharacterized protein LTR77_008782 [Saxophila tyrrhenica]|uniref:NAD(P)-binding domain-containing protein n=1 Tax=Saxophila tyrrhenica TaxID=1690608 RepID=A0AAV9P443_9PEZI|nr:hypothetical protein LTR77_008782 [Saxophila tyrrhenica]
MAHIILTGATGTAGAAILDCAFRSPAIAHISVLSRRPVKLAESQPDKATVIIHKDYTTYPPDLLSQLRGATGCIWAQGISSRGMNEQEYEKITVDYPVAAAKAFAGLPKKGSFKFVYMSGEGADMDGKSSFMFGRVKGKAEKALLGLGEEMQGLKVFNVRPATINPERRYLQERKPTMQDRTSTLLGGVFERFWKSFVIPTPKLAKVCLDLATGDAKTMRPSSKLLRTSANMLCGTIRTGWDVRRTEIPKGCVAKRDVHGEGQ